MSKRYEVQFYAFYDHTGMVRHFEKMARRGWLLEHIGGMLLRYRRIEPRRMRFAVTYCPDVTGFEPGKPESQLEMEALCRQAGWEQAACRGQMQVFYTEQAEAVPLDTDPDTQIDVIHRTMKKNFLPSYIMLSIIALMQIAMQLRNLREWGAIAYFSGVSWAGLPVWGGLLLLYLVELIKYSLWRKRALRRAAEGLMTPSPHSFWVQIAAVLLLVILLVSWLGSGMAASLAFSILAVGLVGVGVASAATRLMKAWNVDAGRNRAVTLALASLLTMALTGGVTWFFLHLDREAPQEPAVPLTLADLGYTVAGETRDWKYASQSMLLSRLEYQQRGGELPWLYYQVADVHFPLLREACLKELLDRSAYVTNTTDSRPWDADAAWKLEREEQILYVLSWGDRLAQVTLDEALTPEQMAVIAEKLKQ